MARVKTAEEIREILRETHPCDRAKAVETLVADTARSVTAQATARTAEVAVQVERKVRELQGKVEEMKGALAVRQRMTPQDLRDALNSLFATYNFSPAEELVQMCMCPEHPFYIRDQRLRVSVLQDLNAYVMPKLKSTEIHGKVEHEHIHSITIVRIGEDGKLTKESKQLETQKKIDIIAEVSRG